MGALPKRRISRQRKGKRRSAQKVELPALRPCPFCGTSTLPHAACPNCGQYKEGVRIPLKEAKDKKRSQEEQKQSS